MFGFAETSLVNQAPAKNAPGLGPAGFDPHAFARAGLRAPLAERLSSLLQHFSAERLVGHRLPVITSLRAAPRPCAPSACHPSRSPGDDGIERSRPALNLPNCPAFAVNGLSRHILARKLPAVFHDPLTAPESLVGRAYRDLPNPSGINF